MPKKKRSATKKPPDEGACGSMITQSEQQLANMPKKKRSATKKPPDEGACGSMIAQSEQQLANKPKKKRSATKKPPPEGTCGSMANQPGNTINLVQCQGIQIGDSNVLNVAKTTEQRAKRSCQPDRDAGQLREELGVLFLKELLEKFNHPITYASLEENVIEKLNTTSGKSFRELSGWSLSDFLLKHNDSFDLYKKKCRNYVRLKKSLKKQSTIEKAPHITPATQIDDSPPKSNTYDEDSSDYSEEKQTEEQQGSDGEWVEVRRKQTIKREKSQKAKELDIHIREMKALCNFEESKFESLVRKGECDDVVHVANIECYLNDPLLFSQHVVGMWNTPQRVQSHIIIGIDAENMIGIDSPVDNSVFQSLFQESNFTRKPIYSCYTAYRDMRLFGVIEISSSCGQCTPSAVTSPINELLIRCDVGDIWIRQNGEFSAIKTTNIKLGLVYKWFLGNSPVEYSNICSGYSGPSENGKDTEDSVDCTFKNIWSSMNSFKRGHFVLLAGDVKNTTHNLEVFARLPWICVLDFDVFSNKDGLLNIVQDQLEKERHLRLRTWKEPSESISEHGTWWCFMRGREELPESRTDLENGEIEDTSIWMKTVKNSLYSNCESLARFTEDYTVLNVLVLWPKSERLIPFIQKTLERLSEFLSCTPNILVCVDKPPVTHFSKTRLQILKEEFKTSLEVYTLSFEDLCQGIMRSVSMSEGSNGVNYALPIMEGHRSSAIDETDAAWLRADFEVLYLDNPYTKGSNDEQALEEEIGAFYKGGNLHWFAWYKGNISSRQVAIERTKMSILQEKIRPHLDEFRTIVITLYHAPGSGGTTLAQAILWKFHQKIPCIHMKLRTGSTSDELVKKVAFLYDKTGLPVLLLVDGEEEAKVRYLSKRLKYAIILYVKRYPYPIPKEDGSVKMFLSGFVTPEEAEWLETKFGENLEQKKKTELEKLKIDVCSYDTNHYLFEFGMTVHLHEFKGIVSYVKGYLQLDDSSPNSELLPWKRCLGYLALVYYYGQTAVPCQFFAALFGKPANYTMSLEDDFPYPIREFVVYDKNESKKSLRICHYIVAKEILEQILTRRTHSSSKQRDEHLSVVACRNLSNFCMEFIEYASRKKTRNLALSSTVRIVLAKTFIFRDEKDVSENEEQGRRRPVLSKIMSDIPSGKPLFTERLRVLQKLSDSFPNDPNFCAHVGRFYAFCRSDDEQEAEKCFKKAICLCEKQSQGKQHEDIDAGTKQTLMHIYHMYGKVKQRNVTKLIRRVQKEEFPCDDDTFFEHLTEVMPIAEEACDLFRQSRDITPETLEVYLYAYTGEIQVRLQICEFVIQHFSSKRGQTCIPSFLNSNANSDCKSFVQHSVYTIENLIYKCFTDVELVGEDVRSLKNLVIWYNKLFQRQEISLPHMSTDNAIADRRMEIAETKLKYGASNTLGGIETIDDGDAIKKIVSLYEQNFSDVQNRGLEPGYSKGDLEREYRDWIFAIRHDKFTTSYSLEDVLNHVEKWHGFLRSPLSTFYLFVIGSLLGFGSDESPGKTECLMTAISLQTDLAKLSHLIIRPKYPREWLGHPTENGIKRLIPGKRHVGVYAEDFSDISVCQSKLALCKGTILFPNASQLSGMIELKLNANSVKVFYIPKRVDLIGKRYVGRRVEFNLCFSIEIGFEAYNVKLLKRYGCSSCSAKLEFTSADIVLQCKCGALVYKDELNEVK